MLALIKMAIQPAQTTPEPPDWGRAHGGKRALHGMKGLYMVVIGFIWRCKGRVTPRKNSVKGLTQMKLLERDN